MEDENLVLPASKVAEFNQLLRSLLYELELANNIAIAKSPGDNREVQKEIDKFRKKVIKGK